MKKLRPHRLGFFVVRSAVDKNTPVRQTDDSFNFLLPRNQISARAVLISGVFPGASGLNLAKHSDVKIPDIRIELRSKRIPGKREVGVLLGAKCQPISSLDSLV